MSEMDAIIAAVNNDNENNDEMGKGLSINDVTSKGDGWGMTKR